MIKYDKTEKINVYTKDILIGCLCSLDKIYLYELQPFLTEMVRYSANNYSENFLYNLDKKSHLTTYYNCKEDRLDLILVLYKEGQDEPFTTINIVACNEDFRKELRNYKPDDNHTPFNTIYKRINEECMVFYTRKDRGSSWSKDHPLYYYTDSTAFNNTQLEFEERLGYLIDALPKRIEYCNKVGFDYFDPFLPTWKRITNTEKQVTNTEKQEEDNLFWNQKLIDQYWDVLVNKAYPIFKKLLEDAKSKNLVVVLSSWEYDGESSNIEEACTEILDVDEEGAIFRDVVTEDIYEVDYSDFLKYPFNETYKYNENTGDEEKYLQIKLIDHDWYRNAK